MTKNTVVFHTVNERTRQDCMAMIDDGELYKVTVKKLSPGKVRTVQQNSAIWLYADMLAKEYQAKDLDKVVVLQSHELKRPWDKDSIVDDQWRPIQAALGIGESTSKISPADVTRVHKVLNKHTYTNFDIDIAFPSLESMRQKHVYSEYK